MCKVTSALEPDGWQVEAIERRERVERGRSGLGGSATTRRGRAGLEVGGVVVRETGWLDQLQRDLWEVAEEAADDQGRDQQGEEDDEHEEIEDGEADDPSFPQAGLLERVDWRPDLTTVKKISEGFLKQDKLREHTLVEARRASPSGTCRYMG